MSESFFANTVRSSAKQEYGREKDEGHHQRVNLRNRNDNNTERVFCKAGIRERKEWKTKSGSYFSQQKRQQHSESLLQSRNMVERRTKDTISELFFAIKTTTIPRKSSAKQEYRWEKDEGYHHRVILRNKNDNNTARVFCKVGIRAREGRRTASVSYSSQQKWLQQGKSLLQSRNTGERRTKETVMR